MNEFISMKEKVEVDVSKHQSPLAELKAVQLLAKRHRAQGMAALNMLFRNGTPPQPPLNGPYRGELIALDLAPGLTQFFQSITTAWMPWLGKTFNTSKQRGDNIFRQDSYLLAQIFNP